MGQSVCLQGRKRAESPPTFIRGKRLKNQKEEGLRILKMRVRELFMHGEGISTRRARHKGRQPLIECAKHDFKIMYFPFLCFFYVFSLFMYFTFLWSTRVFPSLLRIPQFGMRKSDLRSSFGTK